MLRLFFVLIFTLNFSSYVFSHGACDSLNTDIDRCESLIHQNSDSNSHRDFSQDPKNTQATSEVLHFCDCLNVFLQNVEMMPLAFTEPEVFAVFNQTTPVYDFQERIERPPIRYA